MKSRLLHLLATLVLAVPSAQAQDEVAAAARPAVAVVEAFGAALQAGELGGLDRFLDAGVLVLEGGGAERSRAEYLAHHAAADAAFLKGAQSTVTRRRAQAAGDFAWVGTESELRVPSDGGTKLYLGTETMVLHRTGEGWKIVHIHWSSRQKEK